MVHKGVHTFADYRQVRHIKSAVALKRAKRRFKKYKAYKIKSGWALTGHKRQKHIWYLKGL